MMDYSTLVADVTVAGSIRYGINYARIDSAGILDEAQAWIYQRLRVRQMRATADVAIDQGEPSAAFPTGYLDPIQLSIPGHISRVVLRDEEWFRSHLSWDENADLPSGLPTYWADIDNVIQFNVNADQDYAAQMVFYKTPTALGPSNQTNWLTTRYPTLLRRACLMFAFEARKEQDMMNNAELKALQAIEEIKVESDLGMRGMELDFGWEETR